MHSIKTLILWSMKELIELFEQSKFKSLLTNEQEPSACYVEKSTGR